MKHEEIYKQTDSQRDRGADLSVRIVELNLGHFFAVPVRARLDAGDGQNGAVGVPVQARRQHARVNHLWLVVLWSERAGERSAKGKSVRGL
jgi:hypothetical protein